MSTSHRKNSLALSLAIQAALKVKETAMQCDLGGARARSEEGALGLTPYSQFL